MGFPPELFLLSKCHPLLLPAGQKNSALTHNLSKRTAESDYFLFFEKKYLEITFRVFNLDLQAGRQMPAPKNFCKIYLPLDMSKKTNTLLAFLTGATAGALLGILYAPDEGTNTRGKLTYKLSKYKAKLQSLIDELVSAQEIPDSEAKAKGKQVVNDAKEKAEKLLNDVDSLISQIKEGEEN